MSSARRFVAKLAADWGVDGDRLDSLVLVVGELAANAAQHGGPEMSAIGGECGRGLSIVAQLTDWCSVDVQAFSWHVRAGFRVAE